MVSEPLVSAATSLPNSLNITTSSAEVDSTDWIRKTLPAAMADDAMRVKAAALTAIFVSLFIFTPQI
jgi:hypothetical protein